MLSDSVILFVVLFACFYAFLLFNVPLLMFVLIFGVWIMYELPLAPHLLFITFSSRGSVITVLIEYYSM
jgi:hypothetical protein